MAAIATPSEEAPGGIADPVLARAAAVAPPAWALVVEAGDSVVEVVVAGAGRQLGIQESDYRSKR